MSAIYNTISVHVAQLNKTPHRAKSHTLPRRGPVRHDGGCSIAEWASGRDYYAPYSTTQFVGEFAQHSSHCHAWGVLLCKKLTQCLRKTGLLLFLKKSFCTNDNNNVPCNPSRIPTMFQAGTRSRESPVFPTYPGRWPAKYQFCGREPPAHVQPRAAPPRPHHQPLPTRAAAQASA